MPSVITTASTITCSHPGTVTVSNAGQSELQIDGKPALVEGDLVGAPISGCTNPLDPNTGSKPCMSTTSMSAGAATAMSVDGKGVLLDSATGATDSNPPGTWSVQSAGQSLLEAE